MAGYVSKNAANRWNNMANVVSGGGAGSTFVPGLYREPQCALPAGVYPATVVASITSGSTGSVAYNGMIHQAVNQTECAFTTGDAVALCISPACEKFFIGCPRPASVLCCDTRFALCFNGHTLGACFAFTCGASWWIFDDCCDDCAGPNASIYFTMWFECDEATDTITYYWEMWCIVRFTSVTLMASGTGDWSDICSDPNWTDELSIYPDCGFVLKAALNVGTTLCDPFCDAPSPPPPRGCCDKLLWFCINGDSQQLAVNGGTYTWDVSDCCLSCTTATLRLRVFCGKNGIYAQWFFICDGGSEEIAVVWLGMFCTSDSLQIINIDASCFLQMQVSTGNTGCDTCGITTDCCDFHETSLTLQMVVVGGACPGTYSLEWSAGQTWLDVDYPCGDIELTCSGATWIMSVDMIAITLLTEECDPFELVFDGTLVGITSVTVTEP
jgi:hypothetical protein